ncbi:titin homolog isoform X20 [Periplaneta americana]|uniref:titin homolog isoform X20 n=1 Tax=Periplaneta americana TaxID=6978 RepID=UPI0037E74BCA
MATQLQELVFTAMADVAKTVKVVSNSNAGGVSLCELTSSHIEADSLETPNTPPSNPDSSDLTLNIPSPEEGTSLQELIESELALRKELIESQFSPRISNYSDNMEEIESADTINVIKNSDSSVKSSPTIVSPPNYDETDYEALDINTQFILAERNHSFQSFTGNDMFFFNTLDDTQINGTDEQGLADPFLEEEPNIEGDSPHEPLPTTHDSSESDSSVLKDGIDQITLSTFDPFTTIIDSSKSEPNDVIETPSSECADSDFLCLQPDTNNGGGAVEVDPMQNLDENFGSGEYEEGGNTEIPTNEVVSVGVNNSMEEFECETVDRVVTNVFDTLEIDDDEIPITSEEFPSKVTEAPTEPHVTIPEIDVIPPDDNEISESELVSNEELSTASNGPGLDNEQAYVPVEDDDVEAWTTVGEAVEIETETETETGFETEIQLNSEEVTEEADVHAGDVCPVKSTDSDSEKSEVVTTKTTEKKTKKKKSDGAESTKTKKTKKTKKSDPEKENISVKSSFSKFDQLSKKTVLHVRSVDASKVQKQFNQTAEVSPEQTSNCRSCGKQVFQMEQVKAERAVWHKNCFRCKECNKQLTVDIYSSHEGQLYCKPHFRELFKPKAVVDEDIEPPRLRKPELIIRENQPIELPPEVVRASDKPDLGLEELTALNVKSRYQVFEKTDTPGAEVERSPSSVSVKRSPSILSKLAKFQAKGMDIGVTDDSLNGIPYEESSSSSEEEEEMDGEMGDADRDLIRSNRKQRERPVSFSKMEDIKCRWETGQAAWREEQRQERKQEIQNIRSRLFLGKQGKMKEMYEQAVKDSENMTQKKEVGIRSEKAKSIKERFERGEVLPDEDADETDEHGKKSVDEDMSVFEAGISKKSRSLFLELDATAAKTQQQQPALMSPLRSPLPKDDSRRTSRENVLHRQPSEDVVRSSDLIEDVQVETAEVSNKFKFFETYKEPEKQRKQFRITPPREGQVKANSPEREIYRDPDVIRSEDKLEDDEVMKTNTAKKMLSIFRQLEENATKEEVPEGPKPLKRFTPPPDYTRDSETSEEETESEEEEEEEEEDDADPNIVRASDKIEDEFLKQAQNAARAKALRAKFERWEEKENRANANAATNASHAVGNLNGSLELDQSSEHASIDTTKSLRARFESLKNEAQQPKERAPRPKVNRFVEIQTTCAEFCSVCEKKVYPLEKVETGGKLFHKQCFRCLQCNCILRMETYTLNNGKLYCIPHFKQLFIAKGNYEEGFGLDQHKRKWNRNSNEDDLLNSLNNSADH